MAVDRHLEADAEVKTIEQPPAADRRLLRDSPGAGDGPSRADSRAVANAANETTDERVGMAVEEDKGEPESPSPSMESAEEQDPGAVEEENDPVAPDSNESSGEDAEVFREDRSESTDESAGDTPAEPDSEADGRIDQERRREISGEGLPDDNVRVADPDDEAVERGVFDRIKQAVTTKLDRGDEPKELAGTVDRPDFQDPHEFPTLIPDRYGTPLDRLDGTRTPLFDGEPTRQQTKQGAIGDCGIMATLGAVAGHRPGAIRDCVRETDDGNYEVRLHEAEFSTWSMAYKPTGRPITLTVSPDLPIYDAYPDRPAFANSTLTGAAWAPVLEKAIAGIDGTWSDERRQKWADRWDVIRPGGDPPTGYVRLNQGSHPSDRAELLTQLTGQPAKSWEFPVGYDNNGRSADRQLLDEFRVQLVDKKPILVGTRNLRTGENRLPHKLNHGHAYEVVEVDARGRIHLRNPYNEKHPVAMTARQFRDSMRNRYTTLG